MLQGIRIKIMNRIRHMLLGKVPDFTILSNNCVGGMIYHDYGLQLKSPTIAMQIMPKDFIKYCQNIDYYCSCELEKIKDIDESDFRKIGGGPIDFPVGKLGDIIIYFQHDKDFEVAKAKWKRRQERIVRDNIIVIMKETLCTIEEINQFMMLPYKKMLLIERKSYERLCLEGLNAEKYRNSITVLNVPEEKTWFSYKQSNGIKKYYQDFDFRKWIKNK